jgi:GT2 family glycosyltransferase
MKISFIIVLYNSENVLFDCLDSIQRFESENDIEVILIDNHQDSKFNVKSLDNYTFKLNYYKNPRNGGFGYGNNIGVEKSNNEILFFLNPDTILTCCISKDTIEIFKNNKKYLLAYKLIDKNYRNNNTIGVFPQINIFLNLLIKFLFNLNPIFINQTFLNNFIWPWGAAFSIERDQFVNSGGFDENIFLCNEEADLAIRIKERKVKILNLPIIHLEGHTTQVSIERHIEYLKSTFYYLNKHNFSKLKFIQNFYILFHLKKRLNLLDSDMINKHEALKSFLK